MNECQNCHAPADDPLCFGCTGYLRELLIQIRDLLEELETQVTRQAIGGKLPGGKATETPLMFDDDASEVVDLVLGTLAAWALDVKNVPGSGSLGKAWSLVHQMLHDVVRLARDENAVHLVDELRHVIRKANRAIDRKASKIPIGVCPCGQGVFAAPGKRVVTCGCGEVYDVQATRSRLKSLGGSQSITAKDAAGLGELEDGKRFNPNTIRSWVNRGRLESIGKDPRTGDNLYRFEDLLACMSS